MSTDHITILGGGPAGLATAYYASKRKIPFALYEARQRTGGNAVTIQHRDFRFDSGAHRFHDKDPEITAEVRRLLGDQLVEISAPSHIYHRGNLIDFPLSPRSLLRSLALPMLLRVAGELIATRLRRRAVAQNFEDASVGMYGPTIARQFLLNYSQKVWGVPCQRLSVKISGGRLRELSAWMLLREMLFGNQAGSPHLEGRFYYPKMGYGAIVDALAEACGPDNIHTASPVQAIHHSGARIDSITVRGDAPIPVGQVVSTIPLPLFISALDPAAPEEILTLAQGLRFRHLVVVALFLDQDRATNSASLYFPDHQLPFTRIYEPIQRSRFMAPAGKTSLCVEYPCFSTDRIWSQDGDELVRSTSMHLERLGLSKRTNVIEGHVVRLSNAYPVLEAGIEQRMERLLGYLTQFSNLSTIGRSGRFVYAHVHDMLRFGLDVVNDLAGGP